LDLASADVVAVEAVDAVVAVAVEADVVERKVTRSGYQSQSLVVW
jgi:hypothetical protein